MINQIDLELGSFEDIWENTRKNTVREGIAVPASMMIINRNMETTQKEGGIKIMRKAYPQRNNTPIQEVYR
jgi:hypothetical protein